MIVCTLPLRGAGGEPISFGRTLYSHGCAELPPATIETAPWRYRRTLRLGKRVVEVALSERDGALAVESPSRLSRTDAARVAAVVERLFRMDDDLSKFYAMIADDPLLSWAAGGAGRMLSSPTVFEDVVKTICTTNCSWSGTIRMTRALVERGGGAFPDPQTLAETPVAWYRDVARMGYRGPYVKAIARDVAGGALDLERFRSRDELSDEAVEEALLKLPGVGPYAAAHVLQMLGRHRLLVLDSWTRPKYLRLSGRRRASDRTIRRTFAPYREYAGLAFWLYLTRDWMTEN